MVGTLVFLPSSSSSFSSKENIEIDLVVYLLFSSLILLHHIDLSYLYIFYMIRFWFRNKKIEIVRRRRRRFFLLKFWHYLHIKINSRIYMRWLYKYSIFLIIKKLYAEKLELKIRRKLNQYFNNKKFI